MGQAKVVIRLKHDQLLAYAGLVFAERDDAPANGGHMLADRQINPFNERRVDLPAVRCKYLVPNTTR
jgi:hypothetical protein